LIFEQLGGGPADDELAALRAPPAVIVVAKKGAVGGLLADRASLAAQLIGTPRKRTISA